MARTTLTVQSAGAAYGTGSELVMASGDAANGNRYVPGNNDLLIVRNSHDTESGTVTIKGAVCIHGRSVDKVVTAAAGKIYQLRVPQHGHEQTDGYVNLDPSALTEDYVSHDDGTDVITVNGTTAFVEDQPVVLSGGAFGGLVTGTTYYVNSPSGATFKLSATPAGAAIDLTSAVATGTPVFIPVSHMQIAILRF